MAEVTGVIQSPDGIGHLLLAAMMPGAQAKKGHLRTRVEINTPEFILSKYAIVVINTPEPEFCFLAPQVL